ncbi:MAG: choice-of-anchor A family protein, partial [Melioribacteraceae bacterium]
ASGNHLIKHIDVLDPRQSTTFTATYVTGDNDCGQLVNTARAEGHPVNGSATVIDESTWTVNIICQDKADIKIEKTVDNVNPKCDDNVTFTIKATNLGPNTATGVQVSDLLPTGLDYVSSSASHGSYSNTTGIWNIGTIANGAFETLTITVKVDCGNINNSTFNLGTAKDYNLFVIEDAIQPSSDTQGKVAVGRDAQFANYSVGDQLPANSGDVLVVGRDLTYTSGAVYSGNVVYGHSTNLPLSMVSIAGGSLRKDTPINFAAEKVYLENLSTTLSAYTVNGTTTSQWGGLTLTGSDPFLNIFSVSGSVLSTANNFEINVPNGSVVLINVDGTNVSWTGGLVVNGTAISNVLYNFYQATSLTISGIDVRGTILAPFAAVNFASGVLNGQMICKSLTGMGQFNFVMFGGQIPFEKKVINVASVSSCLTPDPDSSNNSSSATVTISNTSTGTGSTGNNGNNGNGTWTNVSSFAQGEIVYTMLYDGGNIYAGTWGGKIYKSTDAGKNWSRVNNGMNVSFIWSLIKFNGSVYAATEKGVFKFDGTTAVGLDGKDIHALATDGTTLYAGTWGFGVFKSTNGTTWTELNNNTFGGFLAIQSLTIKGNELFAGTAGGGIFKSTDGMNFSKLTCGYSVIWSLASTSTTLFSGTYGNGLYRSDDNGISFTKVTSLDITFVYSISVDLSGKIYVSSLTNGVFVSSDNGATWTSLGMSGNGVSSMMVNPNSSDVYVGTKEGKVFAITSSNSITAVEDNAVVPTEFKLAQNYPNPFNPTTTIEFAVPKAGVYSLKVYNVLGEEVANLVDNQLSVGQHKVNFDASRLASGMYIYRLSGSNVNISKKMILMK